MQGSIPGQGTRHMLRLRACMLQLKDPACHDEDRRSCVPQLRHGAAKWINKLTMSWREQQW